MIVICVNSNISSADGTLFARIDFDPICQTVFMKNMSVRAFQYNYIVALLEIC